MIIIDSRATIRNKPLYLIKGFVEMLGILALYFFHGSVTGDYTFDIRLLQAMGKLEEARPLYEEALQACRETLGDRHPDTLASISNICRSSWMSCRVRPDVSRPTWKTRRLRDRPGAEWSAPSSIASATFWKSRSTAKWSTRKRPKCLKS